MLSLQPEQPERQSTILPLKQVCDGSGFPFHVKLTSLLTSVVSVFFSLKSGIRNLYSNLLEMSFEFICNEFLGTVCGNIVFESLSVRGIHSTTFTYKWFLTDYRFCR